MARQRRQRQERDDQLQGGKLSQLRQRLHERHQQRTLLVKAMTDQVLKTIVHGALTVSFFRFLVFGLAALGVFVLKQLGI